MNDSTPPGGRKIRVSVCMATYKGEPFVQEQLESILAQLGPDDEVVVVDDSSPDGTASVVEGIGDARVRLVKATSNKGYVRTFEHAVGLSRGEFIFLSDQDDVWIPGRVELMLKALSTHLVVASNFDMHGSAPRPWIPRLRSSDSGRHLANLAAILVGYRAYYGCGMAFRREALGYFVPVPAYVRESHDLWLAICGNVAGSIAHLDESTIYRRIHAENQTPAGFRSLPKIFTARVMLLRLMAVAAVRKRNLAKA
ncbi:glycosyltransferase [Arthrobacter sp. B6]|uniref:glycosyltransferase n=1 Tax=Arthrobacter sp. B6 TaxID=1570137 RepID=UPI00082E4D4B|nr:glycosyltransferase [Arthrobacter sp. B6]